MTEFEIFLERYNREKTQTIYDFKIISFFIHKGGVGKTTTLLNVVKALSKTKKILVIDSDTQLNSTHYFFKKANINLRDFYNSNQTIDLYQCLHYLNNQNVTSIGDPVNAMPNIDLIPGSMNLQDLEDQLSLAVSAPRNFTALNHIPLSFRRLCKILKERKKYDYIFVDMPPNSSVLYRNILLSSDYYIMPASADIFSLMSIERIFSSVKSWIVKHNSYLDSKFMGRTFFSLPKFSGCVRNNFSLGKNGNMSAGYKRIFDDIKNILKTNYKNLENQLKLQNISPIIEDIPSMTQLITVCQDNNKTIDEIEAADFRRTIEYSWSTTYQQKKIHLTDLYLNIAKFIQRNC